MKFVFAEYKIDEFKTKFLKNYDQRKINQNNKYIKNIHHLFNTCYVTCKAEVAHIHRCSRV